MLRYPVQPNAFQVNAWDMFAEGVWTRQFVPETVTGVDLREETVSAARIVDQSLDPGVRFDPEHVEG